MEAEERARWDAYKAEMNDRVGRIIIPPDPTSAMIMIIRSQLDHLYGDVRNDLHEIRAKKERYEDRLYVVEHTAFGEARNDLARKASAILATQACADPEQNGRVIDLREKVQDLKERFDFIMSVVNRIENKNNSLIQANGALKLEKDLL